MFNFGVNFLKFYESQYTRNKHPTKFYSHVLLSFMHIYNFPAAAISDSSETVSLKMVSGCSQ